MSDQHYGAVDCDYTFARNMVQLIKKDKYALATSGGDTTEAIPRDYKINDKGQHCGIDQQIIRTAKELEPIARKIVVAFRGNHNSQKRGESVDSELMLWDRLGVPYKTVPSLIRIKTPKGMVQLVQGHGTKSTANNDAQLWDLRKIYPGADAYALGHTHQLYAKQVGAFTYDAAGNEHWDPVYFIRTGSFLKYSEYAREGMYLPARVGCVKLTVKNAKIIQADVITDDYFKV